MDLIYSVMPYAVMYTAPLLLVALGGLMSERSGVVNIALEGIMIVGAFVSALTVYYLYADLGYSAVWLGILFATVAGGIYSLLHAYASINLSADQVISGTALNMIAPAVTIFLARLLTGTQNINIPTGINRVTYGALAKIPVIGPMFFKNAYITSFMAVGVCFLVWYLVFNTKFGLRLRSCGENPSAADSAGINVYAMRYFGVFASGLLAGLAGAIYIVTISGEFNGSVVGMGFLGLAALIFGKWNPWLVLATSFFFGFMKTLGSVASVNSTLMQLNLPMELYNVLPYVMTILALVIFSRNIVGPKAAGEPYDKGKR